MEKELLEAAVTQLSEKFESRISELETQVQTLQENIKALQASAENVKKAETSSAKVENPNDEPVALPEPKEMKIGKETILVSVNHPSVYFEGTSYTADEVMENPKLVQKLITASSPSISIK